MLKANWRPGDLGHADAHNEIARRLNRQINAADFGALGEGWAEDAPAINAEIAALGAMRGIVHLPAGHYRVDSAVYILSSNVTLCGAGIGATVIDSSHQINPSNPQGLPHYGTVTVESLVRGVPLANVTLCDLTVKASALDGGTPDCKGIFLGTVVDCTVERVKLDGSRYEGISHVTWWDKVSARIAIRDCIVTNCGLNAIDSNDPGTIGYQITGNRIYNCASGMTIHAQQAVISGNLLSDLQAYGINVAVEAARASMGSGIVIAHNALYRVGLHDNVIRWGIQVRRSAAYDGALVVAHNTISIMQGASEGAVYGLRLGGSVLADGNIIRGYQGRNSTSIAIEVQADSQGGNAHATVINNRVESCATGDDCWQYGIIVAAQANALIANNYIDGAAIKGNGYAYRHDAGGAMVLPAGNIFNAQFIESGKTHNANGALNNKLWCVNAPTVLA